MKTRCQWAGTEPIYIRYHDTEWGVPLHDDRMLFEFLVLEGAQAGLSWITILKKRDNYRNAFNRFDPHKVARYGPDKIADLLKDRGIIRNRLKITSAVSNARAFLDIQNEFSSFSDYIWRFVDGRTIVNGWKTVEQVPRETDLSAAMSRDLKSRGFKFVGPAICYAFMQATGMVNDHVLDCFRYDELCRDLRTREE